MLPRPLASFIGRQAEQNELRESVRDHALTTLVGPPGVGKTRLAVETTRGLVAEFGERRWFVELASLNAPELTAPTVLAGVEAPTRHGDAVTDIARYIGAEPALLVIDNCEHLLSAVAELSLQLLERCDGLRIVATSRSELGVDGEQVLTVRPLETTPDRYRRSDAARLFYDRADARDAELRHDAAEAELVARICARLDGLPLAIELAASRSRVIALSDLSERLAAPLEALSSEPRHSSTTQRSLSDSIAWSFELCGDREQRALEAFSVFGGTFDLAAAQPVLAAIGISDASIDLIDTLVARSLLHTVRGHEGQIRYRMLAIVRAFAQDQLSRRHADQQSVREAHAHWYAGVGSDLETTWIGPDQARKLHAAEQDLPNIREAASYAIDHERPELLIGLILLPAAELWWATGRLQEGMYWLRRIQSRPGLPMEVRFRTLMLGATFAYGLRLLDEGDHYIDEITCFVEAIDDRYVLGAYAYAKGFGQIQHGNPEQAIRTLSGSKRLSDGHSLLIRMSLRTRQLLVYAYNLLGDDQQAAQSCSEILDLSAQAGDGYFRSFAHQMLAFYAWRRNDKSAARRHAMAALKDCRGFPNRPENIDLLIACALLEESWGEPRRAEILLAAAGQADKVGLRPATASAQDVAQVVAAIASRTTKTSRATGSLLTAREAIAFAIGRKSPSGVEDRVTLTPRETEVLHLIREGMANKQIAQALGLSPKTVEGHIARLMAKLGVNSRVRIAMWDPSEESSSAPGR